MPRRPLDKTLARKRVNGHTGAPSRVWRLLPEMVSVIVGLVIGAGVLWLYYALILSVGSLLN